MAQTAQSRSIETVENEAQRVFKLQREAYAKHPYPTYEERIANLRKLERLIVDHAAAFAEAIALDFGHRAFEETMAAEVFTTVDGIRDVMKRLRKWMAPQRRDVSIVFATGKNRVVPMPKGVVGIVSPWNYPLFLTLSPLTSVLAAGNRAMIKMASASQHLCRLLAEKVREVFPEDTLAVLPGVRAQDFSSLPYDHLIFTGSADAGRTVMRAAAENLTPVTLELGGKSPTILCDDFDVDEAAARILYAKFLNAGQTCLAPDYLLVPEAKRDAFVAAAKRILPQRYPDTDSPQYTSVIDDKSYNRLRATLEDARAKGASVVPLVPSAAFNDTLRKIPPHLLLDVRDDMVVMQNEIFGPLLPVKTYRSLDEVIAYVTSKDRPLGFYVFTNDRATEDRLIYSTISGGVTVNNCMLHVAQHDLPFGGIGASGMGQYHGHEGFLEFSKQRPVFTSPRLPILDLFYPPYGKKQRTILSMLIKHKP
ncbi:MAG: coniferyl aldehyde dehydrogenase [Deltaproteobacteria bacterium]|nr:coniferyl aldehyde dehydrogenase [Deltaproteobacteria bacterium]MCW5803330.1 coniferyl aldehyde dehydrogenase [Deltaproteobacteria bacterium]